MVVGEVLLAPCVKIVVADLFVIGVILFVEEILLSRNRTDFQRRFTLAGIVGRFFLRFRVAEGSGIDGYALGNYRFFYIGVRKGIGFYLFQ